MTLQAMQDKRTKLVADMRVIQDLADKEERDFTEDEQSRYDGFDSEYDKYCVKIEREKKLVSREANQDAISEPAQTNRAEPDGEVEAATESNNFTSLGEQLLAVRTACASGGHVDRRLTTRAVSGMSEGVPSDGGFLVQQDFATQLLQKTHDQGQLIQRVQNIPISANSNGLKINAIKETSRVDGSRWGGIKGYWLAEGGGKTATDPEFRQMELDLKKLAGICYATDELLQDASALGAILTQGFADEFTFRIEDAIINGTGAGQPLGLLTIPAGHVTVAKEAGQPANTIVYENIVNMWARLWARSQMNAVWIVNQDCLPQLFTMGITLGVSGTPVYLPPGGASGSPYSTLFGRPVIPIEYCQTIGTKGDIGLIDFSQYLTITKGGIQADQSIHVRFTYDETTFRFVIRIDGQPIWNTPLTPKNGTNTQSPYVWLATRA